MDRTFRIVLSIIGATLKKFREPLKLDLGASDKYFQLKQFVQWE